MKKVVSLMLCCLMVMAAGVFPASADFQESVNFSFDEAEHGLYDSSNVITPYASGLLTAYKLTIGTSGGKLAVSAYTEGVMEATKVGFTYVRIDRLVNGVWQAYAQWNDYYSDFNTCSFGKLLNAPAGYYRAACEHYVEKPRLLIFKATQTQINLTSTFQLK